MSDDGIDAICEAWLKAKAEEESAKEKRREQEDQLIERLGIDECADTTRFFSNSGFEITVTARVNYKVDSGKLTELAEEHGLKNHLSKFFKRKSILNEKNWKEADERYTSTLSGAITRVVGRPSVKISRD